MGVVTEFESAPAEHWPRILSALDEAGIRIDECGEEEGLLWCTCRPGRASLGLALETAKSSGNVCLYCGALHYWSRPQSSHRLFLDVRRVVRSTDSRGDA